MYFPTMEMNLLLKLINNTGGNQEYCLQAGKPFLFNALLNPEVKYEL